MKIQVGLEHSLYKTSVPMGERAGVTYFQSHNFLIALHLHNNVHMTSKLFFHL